MKKFTDEELSRILTAHANGLLEREGECWFECEVGCEVVGGCINQFAYNEGNNGTAEKCNLEVANWFDANYNRSMSIEAFLAALERLGAA